MWYWKFSGIDRLSHTVKFLSYVKVTTDTLHIFYFMEDGSFIYLLSYMSNDKIKLDKLTDLQKRSIYNKSEAGTHVARVT